MDVRLWSKGWDIWGSTIKKSHRWHFCVWLDLISFCCDLCSEHCVYSKWIVKQLGGFRLSGHAAEFVWTESCWCSCGEVWLSGKPHFVLDLLCFLSRQLGLRLPVMWANWKRTRRKNRGEICIFFKKQQQKKTGKIVFLLDNLIMYRQWSSEHLVIQSNDKNMIWEAKEVVGCINTCWLNLNNRCQWQIFYRIDYFNFFSVYFLTFFNMSYCILAQRRLYTVRNMWLLALVWYFPKRSGFIMCCYMTRKCVLLQKNISSGL